MLKAFQRLLKELANPDVGGDPDESLWSPSGWSEAATGKDDSRRFRAPVEFEAPPQPTAQPSKSKAA